ncbi:MAG: amino acid permease [Pseudomonadota bacterium]
MQSSKRKIGVVVATSLSVTMIVGAGLLALPGLSFAKSGRYGYVSWILVAIAMLPLLEIFSFFAKRNPSAGGVVGYVRASLGTRWGTVCETIILGTFTLGVPAIALIGSQYLHQSFTGAPVTAIALATICIAFVFGVIGLRISGVIQTGIALFIVLGLIAIGAGFLATVAGVPQQATPHAAQETVGGILAAIPLILFAFTGWEMTAFLAEDMARPERDMPLSIWVSFVIVVLLYVLIAWIVSSYGEHTAGWHLAPVTEMARLWLGQSGARWVSVIAALLVAANVIAAFISVSRALFSAGRDGILPAFVSRVSSRQEPVLAMALTFVIFATVIAASHYGLVAVDVLLQLAGQNFFVLYLLVSVGYLVLNKGHALRRLIGLAGILVVVGMMLLFSVTGLVYCLCLLAVGLWLGGRPARLREAPT